MKSNRFSLLPILAVAAAILPVFAVDVEIVLPSGANAVERTAAQELAEHWKKVTDGTTETGTAATGTTLLDSFITSSGADDTYTFTISNLKKNEPYKLYLYSANGNTSGNAAFTVGGVTKGVEGLWSIGATPMLTRFDVTSDADGVISGVFAAADGNGAAFNGLTLVGDVREFSGMTIIIR